MNDDLICPYCKTELCEDDLHDSWAETGGDETFYTSCPKCEKDIKMDAYWDVTFSVEEKQDE